MVGAIRTKSTKFKDETGDTLIQNIILVPNEVPGRSQDSSAQALLRPSETTAQHRLYAVAHALPPWRFSIPWPRRTRRLDNQKNYHDQQLCEPQNDDLRYNFRGNIAVSPISDSLPTWRPRATLLQHFKFYLNRSWRPLPKRRKLCGWLLGWRRPISIQNTFETARLGVQSQQIPRSA